METSSSVWIFVGVGGRFPSGVFAQLEQAEAWIASHSLSGVLTLYTVGVGVYDDALERGAFRPKHERHRTPQFIGQFSSGHEHYHYEDGQRP